ncbi:MAG: hypothetical protein V2G42_05300 [bacterium JZ-2024 1]
MMFVDDQRDLNTSAIRPLWCAETSGIRMTNVIGLSRDEPRTETGIGFETLQENLLKRSDEA